MATTVDYIEYVCDQVKDTGVVRYKKMFGEYMVYVNGNGTGYLSVMPRVFARPQVILITLEHI